MFPAIRRKGLTVGVAGVALLAFAASPARADNGPMPLAPAASADLVGAQDPLGFQNKLTDFKTWIITRPGIENSGYIESVNDPKKLSTILLWEGKPNAEQQAIIAEGERRGIKVKVTKRKFSHKSLAEAMDKLQRDKGKLKNFELSKASTISADFDGLSLYGTFTGGSSDSTAIEQVAKDAAALLGIDVSVDSGGGYVNAAFTRVSDVPAFNAGGLMVSPSEGGGCTSGFAVRINNRNYTTTARHCTAHDYKVRNNTEKYGSGVINSSDGAARQMSAAGSALMFDGLYNDTAGYKKTVVGYGDVSVGDSVCTSGANSGVHCGIRVEKLGVTITDNYVYGGNPNFSAIWGVSTGTAACQGDSGGPVLQTAGDMKVKAVGMIQAVSTEDRYKTTANRWIPNGICSKHVYFSSMRTIVNHLPGATLVTG